MRQKSCCKSQSAPKYSYAAALGVLLLGYASNYLASLIRSVPLNLVYWWVTAFLVFASFQISPKRFYRYDEAVRGAFIVPSVVMAICFLPLMVFPQLSQLLLWRAVTGYVVSMGFWSMMTRVYQFSQPMQLMRWGQGHVMWVGSGLIVAIASTASLGVVLSVLSGLLFAHLRLMYREIKARGGEVRLDLSGSLTLAMGMSWGYSFLRLAAASWSMSSMQSLFFCDCWKTMGIVMLADKMRGSLANNNKTDLTDHLLKYMIPFVLGVGYVASVFWSVALPELGWGLPLRIFATVLVSACPCVITLSSPLVDFMSRKMAELSGIELLGSEVHKRCVRQNLGIVSVYYMLSMFLSAGGSYWLAGAWVSPWSAGLLMFAGQVALAVHTTGFMFVAYAQASSKSLGYLLHRAYRLCVQGQLSVLQGFKGLHNDGRSLYGHDVSQPPGSGQSSTKKTFTADPNVSPDNPGNISTLSGEGGENARVHSPYKMVGTLVPVDGSPFVGSEHGSRVGSAFKHSVSSASGSSVLDVDADGSGESVHGHVRIMTSGEKGKSPNMNHVGPGVPENTAPQTVKKVRKGKGEQQVVNGEEGVRPYKMRNPLKGLFGKSKNKKSGPGSAPGKKS